jgi:hypothetical protein
VEEEPQTYPMEVDSENTLGTVDAVDEDMSCDVAEDIPADVASAVVHDTLVEDVVHVIVGGARNTFCWHLGIQKEARHRLFRWNYSVK